MIGSHIALATSRLAEQAQVPMFLVKAGANEILTQSSRYTFRTCLPAAAEAAVPILQLAQQRGRQERGRDHRRLRVGPVDQAVARRRVQGGAGHQAERPGCAGADDQLHAVPACAGRRVADRGDGPSAGRGRDPGSGRAARDEGAGDRLRTRRTRSRRRTPGRRRTAAGRDFKCMATASKGYKALAQALPAGRSRRTSSSRTTRSPATRT